MKKRTTPQLKLPHLFVFFQTALRVAKGEPVACRLDIVSKASIRALLLVTALGFALWRLSPILNAPPRPRVDTASNEAAQRFGLSLSKRREIFSFMAVEEAKRVEKIKKMSTWTYGRRAAFGNREKRTVFSTAKRFDIHVSIALDILQEGIRNHWTADSNGKPLKAKPVF